MIVGAGWAFLGLVAVGIAAVVLAPSSGLLVAAGAPSGEARLAAPALVELDPRVEARSVATRSVSAGRVRLQARRALLRLRATGCDGIPTGSGFSLGGTILVAQRDVLPGAGALTAAPRNGGTRSLQAARVFRLGELAVAQVSGTLPRSVSTASGTALGASVAVVGYPLSPRPRVLPGVVVDRVAGARFGVKGEVMRLTSVLGHDDPGGPVIDARGRIVGVAFTTDPSTGFAVAAPIGTLRSLVARHALEAAPPCDGA